MNNIYIVGNPNSGKTTLFNAITKSNEHVGNWHGVTVDKAAKNIKFDTVEYEIIDLPGIYSLNAFSLEEQVAIDAINSPDCKQIFYLMDINNFKRSMLLALYLLLKNKNIKILINNPKKVKKNDKNINIEYLTKILGCEVELINARKININKSWFEFETKQTAFIKTIKNSIRNKLNTQQDEERTVDLSHEVKTDLMVDYETQFKTIQMLYGYIDKISANCMAEQNNIYGYSKMDKRLLKLSVFLPAFVLAVFGVIYFTFFLVGPMLSEWVLKLLCFTIQKPIMSIINLATDSRFIIALFGEGVFGACFSVLGFLPQICLMYIFLSVLENSGVISRLAFLLDDALQRVGLNGKMVYTMLMGFGCSTTATLTAKNMPNKNAQIKASLLTPLMSCSAKLPIYITIASALFGANSIWVIFGLYMLGVVMAVVLAIILERTILPSQDNQFLIEFPPLRAPQLFNICISVKTSCCQFISKVFGIIFAASVVMWLLNNLNIKLQYVGSGGVSILHSFSILISWIFKPIGLSNPNIVCALLIGLVAKELILSSFAISNGIADTKLLGLSLVSATSAVSFNYAAGISFLVFTLLYFPCVSNFGVMAKQIGLKYTIAGVVIQIVLAYFMSYIVYVLMTKGLIGLLVALLVTAIVIIGFKIIFEKIKTKKIFCNCKRCDKCKK